MWIRTEVERRLILLVPYRQIRTDAHQCTGNSHARSLVVPIGVRENVHRLHTTIRSVPTSFSGYTNLAALADILQLLELRERVMSQRFMQARVAILVREINVSVPAA